MLCLLGQNEFELGFICSPYFDNVVIVFSTKLIKVIKLMFSCRPLFITEAVLTFFLEFVVMSLPFSVLFLGVSRILDLPMPGLVKVRVLRIVCRFAVVEGELRRLTEAKRCGFHCSGSRQ